MNGGLNDNFSLLQYKIEGSWLIASEIFYLD